MPFDAADSDPDGSSPMRRALLILILLLSVVWIVIESYQARDSNDIWWTLRVGDHILTHGEVPRTLLWTMEAVSDLPFVSHGWLAALVFSSVKQAFGLDAILVIPTLIALAVFAAIFRLARKQGNSWLLSLAVANLTVYIAMPRLMNRAEVFGYLFFALALNVLAAYVRNARLATLAWLVPLAVLWTNCHGSFLLLLGLIPLFAGGVFLENWQQTGFQPAELIGSLRSRRVVVLLGCWAIVAVATLINPYGAELIPRTLDQSTAQIWKQVISEWQPLYSRPRIPTEFIAGAVGLGVAFVVGWRQLSPAAWILALVVTGLAISSYRHLAVFGIGIGFVIAQATSGLELRRPWQSPALAALLAVVLLAGSASAATLSFADRSLEQHPSRYITRDGLDWIRRNVRGNVLNRWMLGGVLIYHAWPQVRVSIDSRADPYPKDYFLAYRRALYGNPSQTLAFVDKYGIDHIIVDKKLFDQQLRPVLTKLEGFRPVYGDGLVVVLSRQLRLAEPFVDSETGNE